MSAVATERSNAREVALSVVRDVFGPEQRGAQAAFDFRVRRAKLDGRDRAFTAELAYGAIKMRRLLDWYLAPYLTGREKPLPAAIVEILRFGVYQLRFMHGVEPRAAVYETVNLANRHGHRGTAGLVNAVLRRFLADEPPAPQPSDFDDPCGYLGTAYSLPTWIAAHWQAQFGPACERSLAGIDERPQSALRVNALRAGIDEARAALETAGVATHRSPFVAESLIVVEGNASDDDAGRWGLQSEAACMPVDILAPQAGEAVLEFCSGRGNKTVQIAARMRDEGALCSVEIDVRKVKALETTLERAGVTNATLVCGDARTVDLPIADAVLVDAPCSGLGILGRHPEARWRKFPEDGTRLAALQAELLAAAGERTKTGGRLVYSVCTTDPRETTRVVAGFLAAHPDFARATFPERYAQFVSDGDMVVPPGIEGRDGFYIAALERAA